MLNFDVGEFFKTMTFDWFFSLSPPHPLLFKTMTFNCLLTGGGNAGNGQLPFLFATNEMLGRKRGRQRSPSFASPNEMLFF